jgi:hypothetical protein
MYIYLFKNLEFKPINILIVRIIDKFEYEYFLDNITDIVQLLIDSEYLEKDDVIIYSLVNEYEYKIKNIILPFTNKNSEIINDIGDNPDKINNVIMHVLKNTNCNVFLELIGDKLILKNVDYNMSFLIEKYI